jgi:hypothetical protein
MPKRKRKPKQPTVGEVLQAQIRRLDLVVSALIRVVGREKVQGEVDAILAEVKLKVKAAKHG